MKLISWNVNGLRACVGKGFLDFFNREDADIFCIQETKMQPDQLELDLPGYQKEDVQAELKDGYLVISAKNERSTDDSDGKTFVRRERFYGTCSRSFYVGEEIKQEDISAKFENGVLTMTVPKHVEKPVEEKKYISIAG